MSTYSRPIVFVGKDFEDQFEALDFLEERNFFTDEEVKAIKDKINRNYCSLEECVSDKYKNFPRNETLDYVKNTGYFIGYTVAYYKTETDFPGFVQDIELAKNQWRELFKEEGAVCIRIQTS